MKSKTIVVYEVMIDTDGTGPMGDGTVIRRFDNAYNADLCAAENTCYGRPAYATKVEVPARIAARWGFA